MFYDVQEESLKITYKEVLKQVASYSKIFSESDCPYLSYRAHENIFCKYMNAENIAREDGAFDAKKDTIGIGLKTWTGRDDQKIAEFGKLRYEYSSLEGEELVKLIANYRNERIRVSMNIHGLKKRIYHIVKRIKGKLQIYEIPMDYIDIENIIVDYDRGGPNNTYFFDGKHQYHFSTSKNTLYMLFDNMTLIDTINVNILDDPYDINKNINVIKNYEKVNVNKVPKLCLRLYSVGKNGKRYVAEKSGLNQWNAAGRIRNPNEIYIPYPAYDRKKSIDFFPPRDTSFDLKLPDGTVILAKLCQADSKAIMSNPNKILGEWLLRKVFAIKEGTLVTYAMLEQFGIDSVMFKKINEQSYEIDFCSIGTYEKFNK